MREAATVLLLRQHAGALEVLMMRRGTGLSFMAGMWVFPGGRMDEADQSPAALARLLPETRDRCAGELRSLRGERLPPEAALGLRIAACREAFEEAGVLLALTREGAPCDAGLVAKLQPLRAEVASDARAFIRMLEQEDLYLDLGPLVYWSHWITPSLEPKRFDTRFFVVPVPVEQSVSADLSELTEHAWVNPANAPAAIARGEIRVVPPTLLTLEDLAESFARHGDLRALLRAEAGRPTPPVMPRIEVLAESVRVVMPWDATYGQVPGEGCAAGDAYPPHFTRRRSSLTVSRQREVQQKSEGPDR
jgi:8-oxo-dGTP pyrophosphatase MutT (NUDIX family)